MGIFTDNLNNYFQSGITVIPVGGGAAGKAPLIGEWQKYCTEQATEDTIDKWSGQFGMCDKIGLPLGPANNLVAFDFDYGYDSKRCQISEGDFKKDLRIIEPKIKAMLPQTPVGKVGMKGFTYRYRYNPALKNTVCDRNGVRLFDFLSLGRQTIIPPSIHSRVDTQTNLYKWIGFPLLECLDDIPEIEQGLIDEIKMMFESKKPGDVSTSASSGRHGHLYKYTMNLLRVEKDVTKLADMMIKEDRRAFGDDPKGCYLIDKAHNKTTDAKSNALHWLNRIVRNQEIYSQGMGTKKRSEVSQLGWDYFFDTCFYDIKKDILTKKIFIKKDKSSEWTDIREVEEVLRAYADECELPKMDVRDELARYIFEKDKTDFLCDIPAWDGVDRIQKIVECLECDYYTTEELKEIFMEWGSGIFRRVKNSRMQNRCIIIQGPQNIGKDFLVSSICQDFTPYYETVQVSSNTKDWFEIMTRVYVAHIEEFDTTAKVDVSFLKNIITSSSAFFRESYGRNPSRKTTACSFISTVNPDDFFRDPTGNRRFIPIQLKGIKYGYPTNESLQIMAQFKNIFDKGDYYVSEKTETKIKLLLESLTPEKSDTAVRELWEEMSRDRLDNLRRNDPTALLTPVVAGDVILSISRMVGLTPNSVRRKLARVYQRRNAEQRMWSPYPKREML